MGDVQVRVGDNALMPTEIKVEVIRYAGVRWSWLDRRQSGGDAV